MGKQKRETERRRELIIPCQATKITSTGNKSKQRNVYTYLFLFLSLALFHYNNQTFLYFSLRLSLSLPLFLRISRCLYPPFALSLCPSSHFFLSFYIPFVIFISFYLFSFFYGSCNINIYSAFLPEKSCSSSKRQLSPLFVYNKTFVEMEMDMEKIKGEMVKRKGLK